MTLQIFEGQGVSGIVKSVLAMEADERSRIRSAIFSGMRMEQSEYFPYRDALAEIKFIINEMTEDELGDSNEWADVQRVDLIRKVIEELEKETVL